MTSAAPSAPPMVLRKPLQSNKPGERPPTPMVLTEKDRQVPFERKERREEMVEKKNKQSTVPRPPTPMKRRVEEEAGSSNPTTAPEVHLAGPRVSPQTMKSQANSRQYTEEEQPTTSSMETSTQEQAKPLSVRQKRNMRKQKQKLENPGVKKTLPCKKSQKPLPQTPESSPGSSPDSRVRPESPESFSDNDSVFEDALSVIKAYNEKWGIEPRIGSSEDSRKMMDLIMKLRNSKKYLVKTEMEKKYGSRVETNLEKELLARIEKLELDVAEKNEKIEDMQEAFAYMAHNSVSAAALHKEMDQMEIFHEELRENYHQVTVKNAHLRAANERLLKTQVPQTIVQIRDDDLPDDVKKPAILLISLMEMKYKLDAKEGFYGMKHKMEELITMTDNPAIRKQATQELKKFENSYIAHSKAIDTNINIIKASGSTANTIQVPPIFRFSENLTEERHKEIRKLLIPNSAGFRRFASCPSFFRC